MRPERDYYEVLGVSRDADAKTVKRAFLKLAREVHPDVNDAPDAEARFKEINEAYSVLSDEQRRANYDRFGDADGPSGFGGGYADMSDIFGGFGMSDIFSSFFGGGMGGAGRAARTQGRDMGITLRISLEEAALGCTKTIKYDRLAPCDDCSGTGVEAGGELRTCERCGGTGRVVTVQRTILGQMQTQSACPTCGGSGQVIDHPCETCNGQGRAPSKETQQLEIPAGIRSGQQLVIQGAGEAGIRGAAAGDLVVTVAIEEHERFVRQGDELVARLELDAIDAMLGTSIEFEGILPDELLTIEVPAGCQHGQTVGVTGKGMPHLSRPGRGDAVFVIDVTVPDALDDEQLDLLEQVRAIRDGAAGPEAAKPKRKRPHKKGKK